MSNSSIDRNALFMRPCDNCHGSGKDTVDFPLRDVDCVFCQGHGSFLIPIHELDEEDLTQLSLVAAVESREQHPVPTPIAARAVEASGATECTCGQRTIRLFDFEAKRDRMFHRAGGLACTETVPA